MIYSISGKVIKKGEGFFILESGDWGIKIFSNKETLYKVKEGEFLKVYTHLALKEDKISLYGFREEGELRFFEMLTSVSGVGPKIALSILDLDVFSNTMAAIFSKKSDVIAKASGVGKKTAERIILELHNKINPLEVSGLENATKTNLELVEALMGLGYDKNTINMVMDKFNNQEFNNLSLEEKLKQALKFLANQKNSL